MAEVHIPEHHNPIRTPKQLLVAVLLGFLVPIVVIATIAWLVTERAQSSRERPGMSEQEIAERIRPVGELVLAAPEPARAEKSGKQVVETLCATCHATGKRGAPRIGDAKAWAKFIAQGLSRLTEVAIQGVRDMPPHGGNPQLTDTEIARAIVFMVNQSGANWVEPVSRVAAAPERSGEEIVRTQCAKCHEAGAGGAPRIGDRAAWLGRAKRGIDAVTRSAIKGHGGMPARGGMADLTDNEIHNAIVFMLGAGAAPAAAPAAAAAKPEPGKGKAVFEASCVACHGAGVAGAPRLGDKAAWAPRLKTGLEALYASSLKGKGAMPPKGGNPQLSDAEVKAAVDYMVGLVK